MLSECGLRLSWDCRAQAGGRESRRGEEGSAASGNTETGARGAHGESTRDAVPGANDRASRLSARRGGGLRAGLGSKLGRNKGRREDGRARGTAN